MSPAAARCGPILPCVTHPWWQKAADGHMLPQMKGQLSALAVPADAELLYRRLLRSGSTDLAVVAAELGWTLQGVRAAVEPLLAARLVRESPDGGIVADHPRAALERLIDEREAGLEDRRRELSAARAMIAQFAEDHSFGREGAFSGQQAWEFISAELAPSVVEHLARSHSGTLRSCIQTLDEGPGLDADAVRTGQALLAAGRQQRTIYPVQALVHARSREWMRSWARVGEQQRVMERPPSDFAVFGSHAVMASAEWGVPTNDYVVIRDALLLAVFTTCFEQAWELAVPVPGGHDASGDDRRLLALLAKGYKDEAIARYLGWGLRTVRRRIAGLMADLGVTTRFQLGAAAQRRGLLDEEEQRHARS